MMKVYNDTLTDFSPEYLLQFVALSELIFGADIIWYRIADAMDAIGARGTFIQERRQHMRRARTAMETVRKELEYVFDDKFEMMAGKRDDAYDDLHEMSLALVQMCLLFISRAERNWPAAGRMLKALHNFKAVDDGFGDVDAVLKLYEMKHIDETL